MKLNLNGIDYLGLERVLKRGSGEILADREQAHRLDVEITAWSTAKRRRSIKVRDQKQAANPSANLRRPDGADHSA